MYKRQPRDFTVSDWAVDGRYYNVEDFTVNGAGVTVTTNDCTIICDTLGNGIAVGAGGRGPVQGTIDASNTTFHINPVLNTPQNFSAWEFDNVTINYNNTLARTIGGWAGLPGGFTRPVHRWNNVTLSGAADQVTRETGLTFFPGAMDATSTFTNVSFWNNQDVGNGAAGAILTTPASTPWIRPVFAPLGQRLNATGNANNRMLMSCLLYTSPSPRD